jgi:lauroyl/myristoyl acyltransferase
VARATVSLFGEQVALPCGPFVLSLVSATPIHPLFIVRTGYRKYKIIAREPIICARSERSRDEVIAEAMQSWARVLEENIRNHWRQWFAFTPIL